MVVIDHDDDDELNTPLGIEPESKRRRTYEEEELARTAYDDIHDGRVSEIEKKQSHMESQLAQILGMLQSMSMQTPAAAAAAAAGKCSICNTDDSPETVSSRWTRC